MNATIAKLGCQLPMKLPLHHAPITHLYWTNLVPEALK